MCLKQVLGKSMFSFDELSTILTEIDAFLNSRPLTYTYVYDIEESLTSSHLVIGGCLLMLSNDGVREEEGRIW